MKKDKIIYWISTGLIGAMMIFSGYSYFTNPQIADSFKHIGFPNFFRVELGTAKIIGALVLLIPQIPTKIKEWAYAGFIITFISAAIVHINIGDPNRAIITPLLMLAILLVSNFYMSKVNTVTV